MAKRLNLLPDEYFLLIGLVSQARDYRLCFDINRVLDLELTRANDLVLHQGKQKEISEFSVYEGKEDDDGRFLVLLSNKGSAGMLIPEQKQVDYFVMLKGPWYEQDADDLLKQFKAVPAIQGAYLIDASKLKSRHNLVF